MRHRIAYTNTGACRYYLNDREVTEEYYRSQTQVRFEKSLREMFDAQTPPQGVSDCTFMAGSANGRQFQGCEWAGDYYKSVAESHGKDVTGQKYVSGLARFPGDPEAWVDSRDDFRKVLEKRPGWKCEGTVNYKSPEPLEEPKPGPEVAEDLLEKYTAQVASQFPDAHMIDKEDLKEQVKERIKPRNRPKGVSKADLGA